MNANMSGTPYELSDTSKLRSDVNTTLGEMGGERLVGVMLRCSRWGSVDKSRMRPTRPSALSNLPSRTSRRDFHDEMTFGTALRTPDEFWQSKVEIWVHMFVATSQKSPDMGRSYPEPRPSCVESDSVNLTWITEGDNRGVQGARTFFFGPWISRLFKLGRRGRAAL